MSYEVRFPRPVREKIAGFGLSPRWTYALVREISSFLSNCEPRKLGRRIAAPIKCVICQMDFTCGHEMPASITMWVNETESEGARIVYDIEIRYRECSDYEDCKE